MSVSGLCADIITTAVDSFFSGNSLTRYVRLGQVSSAPVHYHFRQQCESTIEPHPLAGSQSTRTGSSSTQQTSRGVSTLKTRLSSINSAGVRRSAALSHVNSALVDCLATRATGGEQAVPKPPGSTTRPTPSRCELRWRRSSAPPPPTNTRHSRRHIFGFCSPDRSSFLFGALRYYTS